MADRSFSSQSSRTSDLFTIVSFTSALLLSSSWSSWSLASTLEEEQSFLIYYLTFSGLSVNVWERILVNRSSIFCVWIYSSIDPIIERSRSVAVAVDVLFVVIIASSSRSVRPSFLCVRLKRFYLFIYRSAVRFVRDTYFRSTFLITLMLLWKNLRECIFGSFSLILIN